MAYQSVSILGDEDEAHSHGSHFHSHSIQSNTASKTYFEGILISLEESDDFGCLASENQRCYIEGRKVHRIGDGRECGGTTIGPDRKLKING